MSTLVRLPRTWQFTARNISNHLPGPPTQGEIEYVSQMTTQQSSNPHWQHLRHGRVTASIIGKIFKGPGYWSKLDIAEPTSLVKCILGYYPVRTFTSAACTYGLQMEPVAAKLYENHIGQVKLHRVGLQMSSNEAWIAASPDYVDELLPSGTKYLVEIKSFVPVPNVYTFQDLLRYRGPNYLPYSYDDGGNCIVKRTHNHYFQIQCQLYVMGIQYCDLVMFYNGNVQVVRVIYDHEYWTSIIYPELYAFYFRFIVPEMYFKRIKRGIPLYGSTDVDVCCSNKRCIDEL